MSDVAADADVRREGDALVLTGALLRPAVASLWRRAQPLRSGISRIDLRGVERVDSAGLAFLAELGEGLVIEGEPAGLAELRAAYRLDGTLHPIA